MPELLAARPVVSQELATLLLSLYFSLFCNAALWRSFGAAANLASFRGWFTAACLFVGITALQWLLLTVIQTRRTAKPVLTLLIVVTVSAAYYMGRYTVYMDPDMLRNILHTESKESSELLTAGYFLYMAVFAGLPIAALWRVRFERMTWRVALLQRLMALALALTLGVVAVGVGFQDLAALMRNHKEMRYLITPGNVVASLVEVVAGDVVDKDMPLKPTAEDARLVATPGARPKLLVIVVGETVRAQNWGLNGYARQTTPELAAMDVVNFRDVTACGSATEVSLPCMFSRRGRRDYDAGDIKRSESLLHVLARVGISTLWRDNQTGCKGVCAGLPFESFLHAADPAWCDGERCLDEIMLDHLFEGLDPTEGDRVVVLHPLGIHGPSYYSRYPKELRRFSPTCDTSQLGDCSRDEIVNTYDNAVLYTDHVVARTIAQLDAQKDFDTAMLFVSDHGESLGENGLYLHGIPYAIAPDVQTKVPMVLWFSQRWSDARGLDRNCLQAESAQPASHDNLFSTVLGMMQVSTRAYEPALDLHAACSGLARNGDPGATHVVERSRKRNAPHG